MCGQSLGYNCKNHCTALCMKLSRKGKGGCPNASLDGGVGSDGPRREASEFISPQQLTSHPCVSPSNRSAIESII